MRYLFLSILVLVLFFSACKPADEVVTNSPGKALDFDMDTVLFDTVWTGILSPTRRLKVYNPNSEAVVINSVTLAAGGPFSYFVNGKKGPIENMTIRGNDSLLVLVTTNPKATLSDQDIFIEDSLCFVTNGINKPQYRKIIAFGRNATYFNGESLPCNTTWDNQRKPYVIYNSIQIEPGCTLTIKEGVRVLNYANSNIIVKGTVIVNGTKQNPVTFAGTRLEKRYENLGGQWGSIYLLGNGNQSYFNHAIIKNGYRGIQLDTPFSKSPKQVYASINNTIIKNFSDIGLYSFGGRVDALNTIVTDCGNILTCGFGGTYYLYHCTLAFSGQLSVIRNNPAVVFTNFYDDKTNPRSYDSIKTVLLNTVITGPNNNEFIISIDTLGKTNAGFKGLFLNNAIRNNTGLLKNADGTVPNGNIILNQDLYSFKNKSKYDFTPDSSSVLLGKGYNLTKDFPLGNPIYTDLNNNQRNATKPDIGALQYVK